MNYQSDSGAKTNAGLVYPTHRPEAGQQHRANIRPISPPGGFGSLREHSPMMPVDSPGEETPQQSVEQSKNFLKRAEATKAKLANARGSKKTNLNLGWLGREPAEWVGKKIRHRLNGKVFLVRTVFPNGRVELEKSWMMYLSFVWTVRAEYETFSA